MRISKVYTRTGDAGTTGIVGNVRVDKDDPRIVAIGDIDELNSWLGVLASEEVVIDEDTFNLLHEMQNDLFNVGGELAMPPEVLLTAERVVAVEQYIDMMNEELPPLREFILPRGNNGVAWIHVARTVARRAERSLVTLNKEEFVNEYSMRYINRVSDFLFVLARYTHLLYNHHESEEHWDHVKR